MLEGFVVEKGKLTAGGKGERVISVCLENLVHTINWSNGRGGGERERDGASIRLIYVFKMAGEGQLHAFNCITA